MPHLKLAHIVISICFLLFVGALLSTNLTTKVPTRSLSCRSFTAKPMSSVSAVLFDYNKTKHFVLDCITGDVVGVRPSNVATVDVRQLPSSHHNELDQHRKATFSRIFHKRAWGTNSKVDFSASGKPPILMYRVMYCIVYSLAYNDVIAYSYVCLSYNEIPWRICVQICVL